MPPSSQNCKGVTLIELAIVISIIALLIGGVMVGRSLIYSAQVQTIIREYDGYLKALHEFNTKYHALPGDFLKATSLWGTDAGGCPNLTYTATIPSDTSTCNGDGDGRIGSTDGSGVLGTQWEWWRAWQHLVNAKLIDGRFTGVPGNLSRGHALIGNNVPRSRVESGGWTLLYYQQTANSNDMWGEATGGYGHLLFFGAQGSTLTREAVITSINALDLDTKIDDGKPGTGKVRAPRTNLLPYCTNQDSSQEAQQYYSRSEELPVCSLFFILGI